MEPTPGRTEASDSDCLWFGEQEDHQPQPAYVTKALQEGFPMIIPEEVIKCYFGHQIQGYNYFVKEFGTNGIKPSKILPKRLVERLKKEYNLDSANQHYPRLDRVFNNSMSQFHSVLDEATRFLLYSGLNVSIKDKSFIKEPLRCECETGIKPAKISRQEEEFIESKKEELTVFMDTLLENEEVCKETIRFIAKQIAGRKFNAAAIKKESEMNRLYRGSVMNFMNDRKSLLTIAKIRKPKPKSSFVDKHCSICLTKEEEWESHIDSEPLTAEDAKMFHTLLVRSGGMKNLVDFFREMLEARVPPELVSPMFIGSVIPQHDGDLHQILVNYIKSTLEHKEQMNLEQNQETENKEQKYSLEGPKEDAHKYRFPFLCRHQCEQSGMHA